MKKLLVLAAAAAGAFAVWRKVVQRQGGAGPLERGGPDLDSDAPVVDLR